MGLWTSSGSLDALQFFASFSVVLYGCQGRAGGSSREPRGGLGQLGCAPWEMRKGVGRAAEAKDCTAVPWELPASSRDCWHVSLALTAPGTPQAQNSQSWLSSETLLWLPMGQFPRNWRPPGTPLGTQLKSAQIEVSKDHRALRPGLLADDLAVPKSAANVHLEDGRRPDSLSCEDHS